MQAGKVLEYQLTPHSAGQLCFTCRATWRSVKPSHYIEKNITLREVQQDSKSQQMHNVGAKIIDPFDFMVFMLFLKTQYLQRYLRSQLLE